jgi:hypothetical protein
MKKRILVLVIGLLLIGINGFAADGDLIVNGNATVGGNATLSGTLTVQGIKLVHVGPGSNPNCPSGTGGFVTKKLNAKTCTDNLSQTCTIPAGWGVNPTCTTYGCNDYCSCAADTWTEAICMGN